MAGHRRRDRTTRCGAGSGGTGFIDLRQQPKPPQEPGDDEAGPQARDEGEAGPQEARSNEDAVISSSQSEARQASERDAQRDRKSSEFFLSQEAKRRKAARTGAGNRRHEPGQSSSQGPAPQDVPVDPLGVDDPDLVMETRSSMITGTRR